MDFFIDRLYKRCCLEHCKRWDLLKLTPEQIEAEELAMWKAKTRALFWRYNPIEIYSWVDDCCSEAVDGIYKTKIIKQSIDAEKKVVRTRGTASKIINANLKITDVAKKYGLEVKKDKCVCPFHADKDPSLSFNDEKNVFYCFGCGSKGDIIEFIRMMEELNGK
jgi:hypothetical protein